MLARRPAAPLSIMAQDYYDTLGSNAARLVTTSAKRTGVLRANFIPI